MKDSKFRVGDIVKLRASSQPMTINSMNHPADRYVECVWINSKGDNKSEKYHEDALELIRDVGEEDYNPESALFDN